MPRVYRDPNRAPHQDPAWKQRSMTAEEAIAGYRSGEDAPVPAGHIEVSKIWKNSWWTQVPGLHSPIGGETKIPQEPSIMRAMSYAFAMSYVSRKRISEVGMAHFRQTPEGKRTKEEYARRLRIKVTTMPPDPPTQPVDRELAEFLDQHGEGAYNAAMQMAGDLTMLGKHKAFLGLWQAKDSSVALAAEILEQAAAGLERRIAGAEPPKSFLIPDWTPPWRSVTQGEWEHTPAQAVTGRLDWIDEVLTEAGISPAEEESRRLVAETAVARDMDSARNQNMELLHRLGAKYSRLPSQLRELSDENFRLNRSGEARKFAVSLARRQIPMAQEQYRTLTLRQQAMLAAAYRRRDEADEPPNMEIAQDGAGAKRLTQETERMLGDIRYGTGIQAGSKEHLWLSESLQQRARHCLQMAADSAVATAEAGWVHSLDFKPGATNHLMHHWNTGQILYKVARMPEPAPLTGPEWEKIKEMQSE